MVFWYDDKILTVQKITLSKLLNFFSHRLMVLCKWREFEDSMVGNGFLFLNLFLLFFLPLFHTFTFLISLKTLNVSYKNGNFQS